MSAVQTGDVHPTAILCSHQRQRLWICLEGMKPAAHFEAGQRNPPTPTTLGLECCRTAVNSKRGRGSHTGWGVRDTQRSDRTGKAGAEAVHLFVSECSLGREGTACGCRGSATAPKRRTASEIASFQPTIAIQRERLSTTSMSCGGNSSCQSARARCATTQCRLSPWREVCRTLIVKRRRNRFGGCRFLPANHDTWHSRDRAVLTVRTGSQFARGAQGFAADKNRHLSITPRHRPSACAGGCGDGHNKTEGRRVWALGWPPVDHTPKVLKGFPKVSKGVSRSACQKRPGEWDITQAAQGGWTGTGTRCSSGPLCDPTCHAVWPLCGPMARKRGGVRT